MANKEKLEELADVIEMADYEGMFSMGTWGTMYIPAENKMESLVPQMECGFAACAAGWALLLDDWTMVDDYKFEKNGVYLNTEHEVGFTAAEILGIEPPWFDPDDWDQEDDDVELTADDDHLFFWTTMPTPSVIEGIKRIAKGENMSRVRNMLMDDM